MKEFPFSFIGITETWLNSNSPTMFHLPDYEFLRADRSHGKGGGVGSGVARISSWGGGGAVICEGAEQARGGRVWDHGREIF